jgi:hypothetical protein
VQKRYVVLLVAGVALAVPASAAAHARSATVALDYRLVLDPAAERLPGVSLAILDGDRSLQIRVERGLLLVLGDLREPMLRLASNGAWANRGSVTAVAERLVPSGHGWRRIGSGPTFSWHEHRLSPPPYDDGRAGPVARFSIPAKLSGRPVAIGGTFVRYPRPSIWPWVAGAGSGLAALAVWLRLRPGVRGFATTALGSIAGLAALGTLVVFGAADAPNGRVAWAQIVTGVVLAGVLYGALFHLRGTRRVQLAGVLGVAAGAVSVGSLSVFWHGVVISLVSPASSRILCATALVAGAVAAVTSFTIEEPT